MLSHLIATIRRHVVMPEHLTLIVALWVIHTYVVEASRFSPLLAIVSPEYGTGKATLMSVLTRLCRSAYRTSKISYSDLLEVIKRQRPTMLFDDGDSIFRSQPLIDVLNASHDRTSGGITTRAKKDDYQAMGTFVAKATKSHVGLPESLRRRSISIQLQRKLPDEKILPIDNYGAGINDEFTVLGALLARWGLDHLPDLKVVETDPLSLGNDRVYDTFSPLMAIAQVIGADVLRRTEFAAQELLARDEVKSDGEHLLECIKLIQQEKWLDKIHSSDLVDALCARSEWPWASCRKGKPIDLLLLAKMLKVFDVYPTSVRIGDLSKRGYFFADFRNAFARYVIGRVQEDQEHDH
jgi:hypothetical protein